MTDEPRNDDERDRYETPVLRVLQTFKKEAMPAMTEEEGGWLLGQILDIIEQARAAETLVAERARPPAAAVDRELGFVIEKYINGELVYWHGRTGAYVWTAKHDEAIRFARAEDASVVLAWLLNGEGRVTEHMWVRAALAAPKPEPAAAVDPRTVSDEQLLEAIAEAMNEWSTCVVCDRPNDDDHDSLPHAYEGRTDAAAIAAFRAALAAPPEPAAAVDLLNARIEHALTWMVKANAVADIASRMVGARRDDNAEAFELAVLDMRAALAAPREDQ